LKLVLKDNPSFRDRARARWRGSIGRLVEVAHAYVNEIAETLKADVGAEKQVVVIIDSTCHREKRREAGLTGPLSATYLVTPSARSSGIGS
jgi:TPP-dependent indolepyruvate ferredoxin oxidoreductase alpha subunit